MTTRPLSAIINDAVTQGKATFELTGQVVKAQFRKSGTSAGVGAGLMVMALVTVALIPAVLVAALTLGLIRLGLWPWAACLIVAAIALVVAAILALVGIRVMKKVSASSREAITQVKGTIAALSGTAKATEEG